MTSYTEPVPYTRPPLTTAEVAENEHWAALLKSFQASQDADIKAWADKWSGTVTTLIGAFAVLSVVGSPKALSDFDNDTLRDWAFWLLIVAGLFGLLAILASVYVAQGIPRTDAKLDATRLKNKTLHARRWGVRMLRWSQAFTGIAVVLVLAASALASIDAFRGAPTAAVNVLVVLKDGTTRCGPVGTVVKDIAVVSTTVVTHC